MNFDFFVPTKVVMNQGCSTELGKYVKEMEMSHILIIADQGVKKAGLLDRIYPSMDEAEIKYDEFLEIKPNPREKDCEIAAKQFSDKSIDGIVALGGGSVIDTAKSVSILLTNGGKVKDYEGLNVADKNPLPIICIPTTAGTGSEVTSWSIITDTSKYYKMAIGDDRIIPKLALLDVDLTATLPKSIAASTGMDALTHAIEAYTCNISTPMTDGLALHAIKLIKENLMQAVYEPESIVARENMLIASLIAGIAFGNADTAAVHCVSEAIGGKYDTPHGIANSVFLPYIFDYNMDADIERHGEIGYILGASKQKSYEEAAQEAVKILMNFNKRLEIPRFNETNNVNPDDFDELANNSVQSFSNPHNAKAMEKADYITVLKAAYHNTLE